MTSTGEQNVLATRAAVYNYDANNKSWTSVDGGESRVFVFHNPAKNAYRTVGMSVSTKQYILNAGIYKSTLHQKVSDTFIQWRDSTAVYGLSFSTPEEAQKFYDTLEQTVHRLREPTVESIPPPPPRSSSRGPTSQRIVNSSNNSNSSPSVQFSSRVPQTPSSSSSPSESQCLSARTHNELSNSKESIPPRPASARGGSRIQPARPPQTIAGSKPQQSSPSTAPISSNKSKGKAGLFGRKKDKRKYQSGNEVQNQNTTEDSDRIMSFGMGENSLARLSQDQLTDRQRIIVEIFQTERSYVSNLCTLVDRCLNPIRSNPKIFSEEERVHIFSNVEIIKTVNTKVLEDVGNRLNNWSDFSCIGDVFLEFIPFFKVYKEYCSNYDDAIVELERCAKRKEVATYLKHCEQAADGHKLPYLLINPVQRIPRYSLLIQELLKKTDQAHPDYENLSKAMDELKNFTKNMNETVRMTENTKVMDMIKKSKSYVGFEDIMKKGGKLLYEGTVKIALPDVTYTWLLMFEDMLGFASDAEGKSSSGKKFSHAIPLEYVWFLPVEMVVKTKKTDRIFQICSPEMDYLAECSSRSDRDNWLSIGNGHVENVILKKGVAEGTSRVFKYQFQSDMSEFEGEWRNGKPDGKGKWTYQTGTVYEGEFRRGKFHGKGKIAYPNGDYYEGDWIEGHMEGHGVLVSSDATYEGEFQRSKLHGRGSMQWANGDSYEGEWSEGYREGSGRWASAGNTYEGEWKQGKLHGQGTLKFHEGTYMGDFLNNLREGQGKMEYTNGDVYEGGWKTNMRHGQGCLVGKADNFKYTGEWAEDCKNGFGKLTTKCGLSYEGEWKDDRRKGKGTQIEPDGSKYEGEYADDRRHGQGKWTGPEGQIYDGNWHSDKRFGRGTFEDTDGTSYHGEWVNNRKQGKGAFTWANGSKYSGGWENDKRHGRGVFATINEKVKYVGEWMNDFKHGQGQLLDESGVYDGLWENDMRQGPGKFKDHKGNIYEGVWEKNRLCGKGKVQFANSKIAVESVFSGDGLCRHGITFLPPQLPPTHILH